MLGQIGVAPGHLAEIRGLHGVERPVPDVPGRRELETGWGVYDVSGLGLHPPGPLSVRGGAHQRACDAPGSAGPGGAHQLRAAVPVLPRHPGKEQHDRAQVPLVRGERPELELVCGADGPGVAAHVPAQRRRAARLRVPVRERAGPRGCVPARPQRGAVPSLRAPHRPVASFLPLFLHHPTL